MSPESAPELLSVCIMTFNEERNIRDCLASVAWADEIVVVDSFSADATPQICREAGARVVQREWAGYNAQREFALQQATHEWALALDADERVTPELAREIQDVLRSRQGRFAGFTIPRLPFYLGRWIRHGGWYPDRKLRLVRKSLAKAVGVEPHDRIEVTGDVGRLRGDLLHYTYRDLSDHLHRIDKFTTAAAEEMMKQGVGMPLFHMLTRPQGRFLRMYVLRLGFLDGVPGLVVAALSACYVFLKYAKLWEMRRRRPEGSS